MKAKNIFLRVFKLVLLVFFVGNTGIVQGVIEWMNHNKKTRPEREKMWKAEELETKKFNAYSYKVVNNAKELAEFGLYEPGDYFRDWKNIMQFLADSVDPSLIRSTETFFINDLTNARETSFRYSSGRSADDYAMMTREISKKVYPEIEKLRDEIGKKRPDTGPSITSTFFFVFRVLRWVLTFWFTSLPIAFFLMLYWHCRWRRRITEIKQLFIDTLLFPKFLVMRMFDAVLDRYTEAELVARGKIKHEQVYDYDKNGRQYCSDTNVLIDADFTSIREDIKELMWNPRELSTYLDANFGVRKMTLITAILVMISVRTGFSNESHRLPVSQVTIIAIDDDVGSMGDVFWQDAILPIIELMSCVTCLKSYFIRYREKLEGVYVPRFDVVPRG